MSILNDKLLNLADKLTGKTNDILNAEYDKESAFEGYVDGYVRLTGDGDTYDITLKDSNQQFYGRLGNSSQGMVDTPEKSKYNYKGVNVASNPYKGNHPSFIANASGKNVEDVTDEDFNNYNNYVLNSVGNIFTNVQDDTPYKADQVYTNNYADQVIPVKVKLGNQVGDGDSRIVVDFKVGDSTLSELMYNNEALNTNKRGSLPFNTTVVNAPQQGLVDNVIDTAQGAGLRYGASVADWFMDEDTMKSTSLYGVSLYDLAHDPSSAELLAGKSPKNITKFNTDMTEASEAFQSGNYGTWLKNVSLNAPTILAQSLPEMGVTAVAAIATGGASTATQALGMGSAMLLNASTYTSQTMEEYKKNNNGKEMPTEDVLMNLAANMFAEGMDMITFKATSRFIPGLDGIVNKVESAVRKQGVKGFVNNFGNAVVSGGTGEFFQESWQTATQEYFAQDQTNKVPFWDIATSPETIEAGATGAVIGGPVMAGAGSTATLPLQAVDALSGRVKKQAKATKEANKKRDTKVNTESNQNFEQYVKDIFEDGQGITTGNVKEILDTLVSFNGLSASNTKDRSALVKEIVATARDAGIALNYNDYTDVRAMDAQKVHNSLPDNFDTLSPTEKEAVIAKLVEESDLSEEEVRKITSLEKVSFEVRYGDEKTGYLQYERELDNLQEQINKTTDTDQKEVLEESYATTKQRLRKLYRNQVDKANAILEGVKEMANDHTDTTIEYGINESFRMNYEYMTGDTTNNPFNQQDMGAFRLSEAVLEDIFEMEKLYQKYDIPLDGDVGYDIDTFVSEFDKAIQSISVGTYGGLRAPTKVSPKTKEETKKEVKEETKVQPAEPKTTKETATKDKNKDKVSTVQRDLKNTRARVKRLETILEKGTLTGEELKSVRSKLEQETTKVVQLQDTLEKEGVVLRRKDKVQTIRDTIAFEQNKVQVDSIKSYKEKLDTNVFEPIQYGANEVEIESFNVPEDYDGTTELESVVSTVSEDVRPEGFDTFSEGTQNLFKSWERVTSEQEKVTATEEDYRIAETNPTLIAEAKTELAEVEANYRLKKYEFDKALQQYDLEAAQIRIRLESLSRGITRTIDRLNISSKERDALRQEVYAKKGKVIKLEKLDLTSDTIKETKNAISQAINEYNKVVQELADKQAEINTIETSVEKIKQKKQDTIQSLFEVGDNKSVTATSLGVQLQDARNSVILIRDHISGLQAELSKAKAAIRRSNTNVPALQSAVTLDTMLATIDSHTEGNTDFISFKNTLKASNNTFSFLATNKVKGLKKSFINNFKKFTGYDINNSKFLLGNTLKFTPAIGLIYGLDGDNVVLNENTVAAIDLAVKSLATDNSYILEPDIDAVEYIPLTKDSDTTSEVSDIEKLNFVNRFGNFRSIVANDVGQQILDLLGYSRNVTDDSYLGDYEALVTNIGNIALSYMEGLGYIKSYSPEEIKATGLDYNVTGHTVKLVTTFEKKKQIEESVAFLESKYLFDKNPNKRSHSKVRPKDITEGKIHKDSTTSLTDEQIATINTLQGRGYKVDRNTIGKVFYNKDGSRNQDAINAVLEHMGFIFDLDSLPMDNYISVTGLDKRVPNKEALDSTTGSNGTAKKELLSLLDLYDENYEGDYFFEWFAGRNVRFNMKSSDINPQIMKHLQRALVRTDSKQTFDINSDSMNEFYFGIATAFDFVATASKIKSKAEKFLSLDTKLLRQALYGKVPSALTKVEKHLGFELEMETIGHALLAIEAIEAYQNRVNDTFETEFVTEHDATTSGYYIRFMQYANQDSSMLEKVGIIISDTMTELSKTINDLKARDGFLDIYKTTIKNYKLVIPESSMTKYMYTLVNKTIGAEDGALLRQPVDGVISKILRTLAKPATMVFGYGAGRQSIARATGDALLADHLKVFYKNVKTGKTIEQMNSEERSFYNFMLNLAYSTEGLDLSIKTKDDFDKMAIQNLVTKMHSTSIDMIPIIVPVKEVTSVSEVLKTTDKEGVKTTVGAVLHEVYQSTVGLSVYESLNTLYEDDKQISGAYNKTLESLGKLYAEAVENIKEDLRRKYNGKIPLKVYEELVKELRVLMPGIYTALDTEQSLDSKLPIIGIKTELVSNNEGRVTYTAKNPSLPKTVNAKTGKEYDASVTTTPKNTFFVPEPIKGAVVSIHALDAAIISRTVRRLAQEGILALPIHDAIQVPAQHSKRAVEVFNEESYAVNMEYSMFEQLEASLVALRDYVSDDRNLLAKKIQKLLNNFPVEVKKTKQGPRSVYFAEIQANFDEVLFTVVRNRDKYADMTMGIANVSGPEGSTYVNLSHEEKLEADFQKVSGSHASVSNKSIKKLSERALTSKEARIQIFDQLAQDSVSESKEHESYLRKLLSGFNDTLFSDMKVVLNSVQSEFPNGEFNSETKQVEINTPTVMNNLQTTQSSKSTYVHELIHSFANNVLSNSSLYGATDIVRQLNNVYLKALESLDYTAFLKDPNTASTRDVELAKKAYDYVFSKTTIEYIDAEGKKKKKKQGGLAEFVAYGMTNEHFRKALGNVKLYNKEDKKRTTLLERVMTFGSQLIAFVRGESSFGELFPAMSDILTGDISGKVVNKNAYQALASLVDRIETVNLKYAKKVDPEQKGLFGYYQLVRDLIDRGNLSLSKLIKKVTEYSDRNGIKTPKIPDDKDGILATARWLFQLGGRVITSAKTRANIPQWLSLTKIRAIKEDGTIPYHPLRGWGFLQTFLRDVSMNTDEGRILDRLSAQTDVAENAAMKMVGATYAELKNAFSRPLTTTEEESLTDIALATDLSALTERYSISEIKSLLNDTTKLKKTIRELELELRKGVTRDSLRHALSNYTDLLAHFMIHKVGNEVLLTSADQIARKTNLFDNVQDIDVLVTLKSMLLVDKNMKDTFVSLDDKGIDTFLRVHNRYKQDSKDTQEGMSPFLKGYYKTKPTDAYRTMYELSKNEETLKKEGWTKVMDLGGGMAYYRHIYSVKPTRDGSSFSSRGAFMASTAIQEFSNSTVSEKLVKAKTTDSEVNEYNRRARKHFVTLEKQMYKEHMSIDQMMEGSTGLVPVMKGQLDPGWFSYTLSTEQRKEALNTENKGLTVLSDMMGSYVLWEQTKESNKTLTSYLIDTHRKNFTHQEDLYQLDDIDNLIGKGGVKFVLLRPDSPHPYIREYYGALPMTVRAYIESGNELAVREDSVNQLFGVPSFALTDTKTLQKFTNTDIRKMLAFTGKIVKELSKFVKQTVVVRMLPVVISNILGNISTAMYFGIAPWNAFDATFRAFKNTREYVKDSRDLEALKLRKSIGTATEKELKQISIIQEKMNNNPVHDLFQEGLYQSIVEDLKETDYTLLSQGVQAFNEKVLNKTPGVVKEGVKQAYILEGTGLYNFLFEIVQYSDFSARAAHYELLMKKAPTDPTENAVYRKNLISDMRDIYINYNRPNSRLEQFFDDFGLLMFIKYAKRVNGVIQKGITDHPVNFILASLFQMHIYDTPDMLEANMFERNWMNNVHSVYENVTTAAYPSLIREGMALTE